MKGRGVGQGNEKGRKEISIPLEGMQWKQGAEGEEGLPHNYHDASRHSQQTPLPDAFFPSLPGAELRLPQRATAGRHVLWPHLPPAEPRSDRAAEGHASHHHATAHVAGLDTGGIEAQVTCAVVARACLQVRMLARVYRPVHVCLRGLPPSAWPGGTCFTRALVNLEARAVVLGRITP